MGMFGLSTTGKMLLGMAAVTAAVATLGESTQTSAPASTGSFFFGRYMIGAYIAAGISYYINHSIAWALFSALFSWLYLFTKIALHFI